MAVKVNTKLIKELKKYGKFNTSECFNCGNCTAICPLSEEDSSFPRRVIRYAHLGCDEILIKNKSLWLCYYCGECSKTCPRDANPAALMASARRYAISRYDITGISKYLYTSNIFNLFFSLILALFFALFMYANKLKMNEGEKIIEIFKIPFGLIHDMGVVILIISAVSLFAGLIKMSKGILDFKKLRAHFKENPSMKFFVLKTAIKTVVLEIFAFKRYQDCNKDRTNEPIFLKPWFLHASTVWGFIGLLLATTLDLLFKDPEILVSLWYPPRLIGTIGGILLMYGTSVILWKRFVKHEKSYDNSTFSDWWFLVLLWITGVTGFILEFLVYLIDKPTQFTDILFILHASFAMLLVSAVSYTKFAHVFYRSLALFFYSLNKMVLKEGNEN